MQIHTEAQPPGCRQASPVAVQRSGQSGLHVDADFTSFRAIGDDELKSGVRRKASQERDVVLADAALRVSSPSVGGL
jgi:hypothetical protein